MDLNNVMNLILQACRIFLLGWHLLVLEGGPMSCQYVGANIFHI